MAETKKPIAEVINETVDSCELVPGQRYIFYCNFKETFRGTFKSYNNRIPVPTECFIITHYCTSEHYRQAYFSLSKYYVHYILKLYVNFQCLPKELNDIINAYY